jgi:hypothetical protein
MNMNSKLLNFLFFQTGWMACVLGAANGMPWLGLIAVGVAAIVHFKMASNARQEGCLMLLAVLIGLIFDSLLVGSGWVAYPNGMVVAGVAPYWILALWALFATTMNVSMSWIKTNVGVAALLGAIGGPLSYMAGQRLGGLQFVDYTAGIIALALIWAIATPLLVVAARRYNGFRAVSETNQ